MRKPIVYLDAQDFSNLSDALAGRAEAAKYLSIYEKLHKLAKDRSLAFCFSQMIVSEVLQLSPESVDIARRKAKLIESLCGHQAFPNPFWLLAHELRGKARDRGHSVNPLTPTLDQVVFGGKWAQVELLDAVPVFQNFENSVASKREEVFANSIGYRPSRRDRRKLAATNIAKSQTLKIVTESELFPVIAGTDLVGEIQKLLLGKKSKESVMEEFFALIAKPTRLILAHDNISSMQGMNASLEVFKGQMFEVVTQLRGETDLIGLPRDYSSRSILKNSLTEFSEQLLERVVKGTREHFEAWGVPTSYIDGDMLASDIRQTAFMSVWRALMTAYMSMIVDGSGMRRSPLRSDVGDILHGLYIPHCTVWRSDKYFAGLASPIAKKFGCAVLRRIEDLPACLDEILRRQ